MQNMTFQIAPNVWAILTYEESWKSYINSYVISKENSFLLIDTNLRKHRSYFQQVLQDLGALPDRIEYVYCTHRHPDHIGNIELFSARNNWIHLDDFYELDDFSQTLFGHTFTGSGGDVPDLQYVHLPGHTEGATAFFHKETGICFIGDHICFFGSPLGEILGEEKERRKDFLDFLIRWKEQEPDQAEAFFHNTKRLMNWPIDILATGHGPILKGNIKAFLHDIMEIGREYVNE